MRRFIIALVAFFLPFVIVAAWRRLKAEPAPAQGDSRVWIIGCLLCAASFAAAALLERGQPSGHYVETHDAQGHPVSVYRNDP